MKTFILIVYITINELGTTTHVPGFSTFEECTSASSQLINDLGKDGGFLQAKIKVKTSCVAQTVQPLNK
jgi:hypothetical protein